MKVAGDTWGIRGTHTLIVDAGLCEREHLGRAGNARRKRSRSVTPYRTAYDSENATARAFYKYEGDVGEAIEALDQQLGIDIDLFAKEYPPIVDSGMWVFGSLPNATWLVASRSSVLDVMGLPYVPLENPDDPPILPAVVGRCPMCAGVTPEPVWDAPVDVVLAEISKLVCSCCPSVECPVCDDGDECTRDLCEITCFTATCENRYTGYLCDGEDVCKIYWCDSGTGCEEEPKCPATSDTCNDRRCDNGECRDEPRICDDEDPCTDDSCVVTDDLGCVYEDKCPATSDACNDRSCDNGTCRDDPVDCDFGNPCRRYWCDVDLGGCQNEPLCNEEDDLCTTRRCDDGDCKTDSTNCDDGNECTTDSCNVVEGCQYTPRSGSCDAYANDPCNDGICSNGSCVADPLTGPSCDSDEDTCTDYVCFDGSCIYQCSTACSCGVEDCCPAAECCGGRCCPSGANGVAVAEPQVCCDNVCCATGLICCGGLECRDPANCCEDGTGCDFGQECCSNGLCCIEPCDVCTNYGSVSGGTMHVTPSSGVVCVGDTIMFTAVGVTDSGGQKSVGCNTDFVDIPPGVLSYAWTITKPDLTTVTGTGSVASIVADLSGNYSCQFVVSSDRTECPPIPSSVTLGPGMATAQGPGKVSLGGVVSGTSDPGCFKAFVPTKWGGKLTVSTTSGMVQSLAYPDGAAYANGSETGEDKHGWYTFKVTGSTAYDVSATFFQEGQATTRPWNFYWWAMKGDYIFDGGNAVSDTTAVGDDIQVVAPGAPAPNEADVVRSGPNGTLETTPAGDDVMEPMVNLFDTTGAYQPLVKYDARHGTGTTARDWEAANGQGTDDWHGHCLGAAMASILLNQPVPVAGSAYSAEELEGLWAELGEKKGIYTYSPDSVGGIPAGPPTPGGDLTDTEIGKFHALVERRIRSGRVALQSNLRCADCEKTCWGGTNDGSVCATDADCPDGGSCRTEIWNHAVYKFSATYEEAPGGNEKIVRITNTLLSNDDHEPPTGGAGDRQVEYVYIVEYTSTGEVNVNGTKDFISVGGDARFAPSNLLHVTGATWGGNNPHVTSANVSADDAAN